MKNYLLTLLLFISFSAIAQDNNKGSHFIVIYIPDMAGMEVEGPNTISLSPIKENTSQKNLHKTEAIWLNIASSLPKESHNSRHVNVEITQGSVPEGLMLFVNCNPIPFTNNLNNKINNFQNKRVPLINEVNKGIGGYNVKFGYKLNYTLEVIDESLVNLDKDNNIVVTYTIYD